jgi:hypothetical protein
MMPGAGMGAQMGMMQNPSMGGMPPMGGGF